MPNRIRKYSKGVNDGFHSDKDKREKWGEFLLKIFFTTVLDRNQINRRICCSWGNENDCGSPCMIKIIDNNNKYKFNE